MGPISKPTAAVVAHKVQDILPCTETDDTLTVLRTICLFSWRYNPLWLYFHSPIAGFSLLVFEVS